MNNSQLNSLHVPKSIFDSWQNVVDLLAVVAKVPVALIMRVEGDNLSVFRRSNTPFNPFHESDKEPLGCGQYCETVLEEQALLHIPNAYHDKHWCQNPDLKLGMLAYCGVPINWPNGAPFGTICMQDSKCHVFSLTAIELLNAFKVTIEAQLETIYQKQKLLHVVKELRNRVKKRTHDLAQLNYTLSQEIDRRKAAEDEISYQKMHDLGTGFLNRQTFEVQTNSLLEESKHSDKLIGVIYVGIVNGRQLQKKYGHEAFDQVVTQLRARLAPYLPYSSITGRPTTIDIAFTVKLDARLQIEALLNQILEAGQRTFEVDDYDIHLRCHVGIAYQSINQESGALLIEHAQEAMLGCKDSGEHHAFHNQETVEQSHSQLESYLVQAVRNDDISLYFQPKVSPASGVWTGAEALIRWEHPELGPVSSELLIKMAEDNGLIFELGNYVLRTAIEQAAEWHQLDPSFTMAVNISLEQLRNPRFTAQVNKLLNAYNLPASVLELELTETSLLSDEFLAGSTLNALHEMGVGLSLDDFGTGYTSFNSLRKYPFSTIKIDKSFLTQWNTTEDTIDLLRSIIGVAKKLNLTVVMEGIETEAHQQLILQEGADFGQGYFYGKPMPKGEFELLLKDKLSVRQ